MIENLDPIREAITEAKRELHNADSQAFLNLKQTDYKQFHNDYLEALNILDRLHQFRPKGQKKCSRK